ncbi:MAG: hypothetical protein LBJ43_00560 [Propionibacteriaceae bacterium]|jgi:hypothetical protein|nr:hypothetical protein [Propionibacteriaceae bacterium]
MSVNTFDYAPDGVEVLTNERIVIVPAIADIQTPTVSELNTGVGIQCAIESWGVTRTVGTVERQKLCMRSPKVINGRTTYSDITLNIDCEDPQDPDDKVLALCTSGTIVYTWSRPGKPFAPAAVNGDLVEVTQCRVISRNLAERSTTEGAVFQWVVILHPEDATDILVSVVDDAN